MNGAPNYPLPLLLLYLGISTEVHIAKHNMAGRYDGWGAMLKTAIILTLVYFAGDMQC